MKNKLLSNVPSQILNEPLKIITLSIVLFALSFNFSNAQNANANENATVYGGDLAFSDGSDYTSFCIDGEVDTASVTLENASGRVKQWIITDEDKNILALPDDITDVDFDEYPIGKVLLWHLSYNGIKPLVDPSGQMKFTKNLDDIVGRFHLSNPITVEMFLQPTGGTLEGGPFDFCVGDGEADHIPDGAIMLSGNMGTNSAWVITDLDGNILGLPAHYSDVNFDEAPAGTCLVWHLSYEDNVILEGVENAADLTGCFEFTNPIEVLRYQQPIGGTLEGGPFEFCVGDGEADHIPDGAITLSGNMGTNSAWVITDLDGNILGLPATYSDVNFDEAPAGTCLVWHLMYENNVSFEGVTNAADLAGCFALTNPIEVFRYQQPTGGTLEGGPFVFCVGDGVADNIVEGAIMLSGNSGTNSAWVVTDEAGNILGLPANYTDVNFDEAPAGTCLVWHLSYEDNVSFEGVTNAADLTGCFALTNAITVVRNKPEGGTIAGGPFAFTIGDGTADNIAADAITLTGNVGGNSKWVITNEEGTIILGLADSYSTPNFDGTGAGICKIWHLSYEDGLQGLTPPDTGDHLVSGLVGCFSLSNAITITRTAAAGTGKFYISPNPAKGTVKVEASSFSESLENVNISIFTLQNVPVFSKDYNLNDSKATFNVSGFEDGVYFVRVTDKVSGLSAVKRLVVD